MAIIEKIMKRLGSIEARVKELEGGEKPGNPGNPDEYEGDEPKTNGPPFPKAKGNQMRKGNASAPAQMPASGR